MPDSIRTILIDDEPKALFVLSEMVKRYCPELEIVGTAANVAEGKELLKSTSAELLFLDIDLPDGYGFHVLEDIDPTKVFVVFTTAFSHFAARAFEFAALHYLLKPINVDQLKEAVNRYKNRVSKGIDPQQLDTLTESLTESPGRVTFETNNGLEFVEIPEIVFFESSSGVTFAELSDGSKKILSKSLNHFEELLESRGFYRVHAKYLVNLGKVTRISSSGRSAAVLLSNGVGLEVSTRKKQGLIERMKNG